MQRIRFGKTKLDVSRLCFGTEPFALKKGPNNDMRQGDRTPSEGGEILSGALKMGVNFWDTSDDYGTHPHIAEGLKRVTRHGVVVADKTNAKTHEEGNEAVKLALNDLGTDYIDIMFLHNVPAKSVTRRNASDKAYESASLQSRMGALRAFTQAKESGTVRAIGLSTHSTHVLRQALKVSEIDVVCTPLNSKSSYLDDGTMADRIDALRSLKQSGKGVYVIKLLEAGRLRDEADAAIRFALRYNRFIDAWNIGMYSLDDVSRNMKLMAEELGKIDNV